jgi:hypothetical protein
LIDLIFYVALSGLLAHELDAVQRHEWRLLFVLRRMPETRARDAFILVHVPIVALILWLAAHPDPKVRHGMMLVLDVFVLVHAGLHWRLSTHPKYEFYDSISKVLIYAPAVIALGHLTLRIGG